MLGEYLLTAALLAGQPPAAAAPAPAPAPAYLPAVQAPAVAQPAPTYAYPPYTNGGTATPNGSGGSVIPNGNGNCNGCEPAAEERTKYCLEKLTEDCFLGRCGWRPYGWSQTSQDLSSASQTNRPVAFNDQANEFLYNQLWLGLVKEVDPTKKCFQLGGRAEIFWGSDARFTLPRGMFNDQLRRGELYPYDIYQFYTEAFLPGVGPEGSTVRMGRFATHCSYEVTQGPDTPFLSRSYLFLNNPFTHTGVWAISPLNDTWTVSNGVATGSDVFIDPAARPTYLGQLRYAPKDGPTQVLFNTVLTDPQYDVSESFLHYNVYNLQVIHKASEKLTAVLDTTYSHTYDVPGIGFADWYGAAGYLFYNLTDKMTYQTRLEAFNDPTGFRTGFEGFYSAVTTGPAWKPMDWMMIRPAVRYDVNDRTRAFEGDYDLFTMVMDVIVRW